MNYCHHILPPNFRTWLAGIFEENSLTQNHKPPLRRGCSFAVTDLAVLQIPMGASKMKWHMLDSFKARRKKATSPIVSLALTMYIYTYWCSKSVQYCANKIECLFHLTNWNSCILGSVWMGSGRSLKHILPSANMSHQMILKNRARIYYVCIYILCIY